MDGNGALPKDPEAVISHETRVRTKLHEESNASQEIPHLQLVDLNAKSLSSEPGHKPSDKSCELVHVKEELESSRDSADCSGEEDNDSFIGGEIHPDVDVKAGICPMNDSTPRCANCSLTITMKELSNGCKNFHEFLPLQLLNAESGDLMDVEFIDAISEIFKLQQQFKHQSFKKIYQRNDLYLCKKCCDILVQMYKLYHEFSLIAMKSNSFLASYIHRKKVSLTVVGKGQSRRGRKNVRRVIRDQSSMKQGHNAIDRRRSLRERRKIEHSSTEEDDKGIEESDDGSDKMLSDDMDIIHSPFENTTKYDSHESASSTKTDCSRTKISKKKVSNNKLRKCDTCNFTFKFPAQLLNHLKSRAHKSRDISAASTVAPGTLICPEPHCNKKFSHKKPLQRHMKAHNWTDGIGSRGECDRCGKKFKTLGGLKIHYASHVRDDQKYSCKMCSKKFRKQEALEMHLKTDHGGFKPHKCGQCEKSFRLKDKLKLHIMVIHNKTKPFPCSKCHKGFRTKYHLKIHDVSQHIQGGDSTVGCSQCKSKFPDMAALEKHVVIHSQDNPFICDTCGKGFQTAARLKLHDKSHQEMPSCLCPICGRAYKHIRDLRLHEVIHQDESTYRFGCGDCPRRFYRIDLLRVHQSNEKHFASETIGPSMSKLMPSKEPELAVQNIEAELEEDEEDENETDSEIAPPPPPKAKKKLKTSKQDRVPSFPEKGIIPSSSVVPSHLIYHPSLQSHVVLQLDHPSNILASSRMKNHSNSTLISSSGSYNAIAQQRHINNQGQGPSSSCFVAQRDRQNVLHPALQIQTMSSAVHAQNQFGNQTLYTSHPINMTNGPGGGTDHTGFDFINSFHLG